MEGKRRDSKMQLLLHDAVSENDLAQVKFCVKFQPKHSINRTSPDDGLTPLLRACKLGFTQIARILLDNGAMVEDRDENGNTCLHYAAMDNNTELVQLLLNCCARTFVRNNNGQLPIDVADDKSSELISDKMVKDGRDEFVGVCKMMNLSGNGAVMTSYHQNNNVKPATDVNDYCVRNGRRLSDGQLLKCKWGTHWDLQTSFLSNNEETSVASTKRATKSHSTPNGLFKLANGHPQKPLSIQPLTNGNLNDPGDRKEHQNLSNSGFTRDAQHINGIIKPTKTDHTDSHFKSNGHTLSIKSKEAVENGVETEDKAGVKGSKQAVSYPCKFSPPIRVKAYDYCVFDRTLNGLVLQQTTSENCSSRLQNGFSRKPPSPPPKPPKPFMRKPMPPPKPISLRLKGTFSPPLPTLASD